MSLTFSHITAQIPSFMWVSLYDFARRALKYQLALKERRTSPSIGRTHLQSRVLRWKLDVVTKCDHLLVNVESYISNFSRRCV